jgi:HEAT repeat protein
MDLPDTVMRTVPKPMQGIAGLATIALLAGLGAWAVAGLTHLPVLVFALGALGVVFAGVAVVALIKREERGLGLPIAAFLVNVQALVLAFVVPPATSQPPDADGPTPKSAPANTVAQLRQALKSGDAEERMYAAYKVGEVARDLNKTVEELITLLRDNQPAKVKLAAAEALGLIGPQARIAYPILADVNMADDDKNVRDKAKESMDKLGAPTLSDAPLLLDKFKDRKNARHLRAAAAWSLALANANDRTTLQALKEGLRDPDAAVRVGAAHALWLLGERQTDTLVEPLVGGLKDVDPVVKAHAALALFAMGPDARAAAQPLEVALGDSDTQVRLRAAQALWALGPPAKAQVPRLLESLKDKDARVRIFTANALWTIARQKEGVPVLCETLKSNDLLLRQLSVKSLYNIAKDAKLAGTATIANAVPALIDALKDSDSDVRGIAAWTLGAIGKEAKAALPMLVDSLKHKDATFRAEVAHALATVGQDLKADAKDPVVAALKAALQDRDNTVRIFAAQSLWAIERNAATVWPTLLKVLREDPDRGVRAKAAFGLGVLGAKAKPAVPALNAALKDPNPLLRLASTSALGKIGQAARVSYPTLDQLAKDEKQPEIKRAAAEAMKKIGQPTKSDVPELIGALEDNDPDYRAAAVVCLWMLFRDARDAVVPLSKVLIDDQDETVRGHAAFALAAIGPDAKAAVPALIKALKRANDDNLRLRAAYALGEIGANAKEAIPALKTALKDNVAAVRLHAAQALWIITQQPQEVLEALTGLVDDRELDTNLLLSALETLTEVGPKCASDPKLGEVLRKETVKALAKAMSASDESVRLAAIATLGSIGVEGREGVPDLLEALLDADAKVRLAGIDALARVATAEQNAKVGMRSKTAYARLLFVSKADSNDLVRYKANQAMIKMGPPGVGDVAEMLAIGGDKGQTLGFRSAAVQVLGLIGQDPKIDVDGMCKLLTADEPAIRALIASALGELGLYGKAAIGPLTDALKDADPYVRGAVAQALGAIGPFHPAACQKTLPVLDALRQNDPDDTVRRSADDAFKKIGAVGK